MFNIRVPLALRNARPLLPLRPHLLAGVGLPSPARFQVIPAVRAVSWASASRRSFSSANPKPAAAPAEDKAKQAQPQEQEKEEQGSEANSDGDAGKSQETPKKKGFFQSDDWIRMVGYLGALANWGIPLAAITHFVKDMDAKTTIDPRLTTSLLLYSMLFIRWALAITPANYPLSFCHVVNFLVQGVQLGRWFKAHYL